MEKILHIENIVMSHNTKYYVKCLKRNKLIRLISKDCERRKNIQKKYIVLKHWQILQLLTLEKYNVIELVKLINILFSLCYMLILLILVFWTNCFSLFKGSLSNFASVKFVSVKGNFAWIAKKLTSISSFNK